jgi:hypothetical protein
MQKIHYQTDQEDLMRLCDGQMFTLYDDNIKSAASDTFTKDMLREYAPDKDHFMLHVVAMGDQETYGPNKNGDGFPKEALEKFHPTFVSDGCFFREHRNRCQETQGIGSIKASAYNPKMRRVELIVHGNKEKAAKEYEMAKAGKALSFSMSCRVPYDTCSCCEKKASSPASYCDHLKNNMLQYLPEFQKYAFAINDKPKFFDISAVAKPADRIAHYLDYAFPSEKRASFSGVITGTQWAAFEGVTLPEDKSANAWSAEQYSMLQKLASCEDYINAVLFNKSASSDQKASFVKNVVPHAFNGELDDASISKLRTLQVGTMFYELAKRASILPFNTFTAYATGRSLEDTISDPVTKKACDMLPQIFKQLMTSGCGCELGDMFNSGSQYTSSADAANDDEVQKIMDMAASKFSIKTEPVKSRVITITITKGASEKTPVLSPSGLVKLSNNFENRALALAESYGLYKLSALLDFRKMHGDEIEEAQYLLAAGQNLNFN